MKNKKNENKIFKIFTSEIEAWTVSKGDSQLKKLRGIASGTALDAEGDRMSEEALSSMENQIVGLTLHKDHVFNVDNTIGHFVDAKILTSSDGDVKELWVEAQLEPFDVNPDAERIFEKIKSGTRLAFSVAGILKGWEKIDSKDGIERFLITDIELLSVDLVTIPAYRASQGSLSAFQASDGVSAKGNPEVYVCKQLGKIIRDCDSEYQSSAEDPNRNNESELAILESKFNKLEKKLTKILEESNTGVTDLIERIERIEAQVVHPPKSKGLMVQINGKIQPAIDDSAAFEKNNGNLLGGF